MIVCKANYQDLEDVVKICRENLLVNKRPEEISARGFLMSELTEDVAKKMLDEGAIFLVARRDEKICGYLTAHDLVNEDEIFRTEVLKIKDLKNAKIIYYKQIAKSLDEVGIGKNLVEAMCDEAKKRGYSYVVCKIVLQPFYNQASVKFHEKNGFVKMKEVQEKSRVVGVFARKL